MAELSLPALALALLAFGSLVALFAVAAESRRLASEGPELPLWMFLRRRGLRRDAVIGRMGERTVRIMEMHCSVCESRRTCLARLAQGSTMPPADCPNAALTCRS